MYRVKMTLPEDSTVEYDEIDTTSSEEEFNQTTTFVSNNAAAALLRSATSSREQMSLNNNNKNNAENHSTINIDIISDNTNSIMKQQEANQHTVPSITSHSPPCDGQVAFHSIGDDADDGEVDKEGSRTVWRPIPKKDLDNNKKQQHQQNRTRKRGKILQHQSINSFSHGDLRTISNNNNNNKNHLNNHRRSSTENLHLSKKNLLATNILHRSNHSIINQQYCSTSSGRRSSLPSNTISRNNARSLPASPLMSPRLMTRRAQQDHQIISPAAFIPCPPSSDSPRATKENKLSPRRCSSVGLIPIEKHKNSKNNDYSLTNNNAVIRHIEQHPNNDNTYNNDNNHLEDNEFNDELYCSEDEEIRILNLSPSPTPPQQGGGKFLPQYNNNNNNNSPSHNNSNDQQQHRLKDDFLLKYALRRTQRYTKYRKYFEKI